MRGMRRRRAWMKQRIMLNSKVLNAEIEQIVAREQVLRDEIAKIIAEIEVEAR